MVAGLSSVGSINSMIRELWAAELFQFILNHLPGAFEIDPYYKKSLTCILTKYIYLSNCFIEGCVRIFEFRNNFIYFKTNFNCRILFISAPVISQSSVCIATKSFLIKLHGVRLKAVPIEAFSRISGPVLGTEFISVWRRDIS